MAAQNSVDIIISARDRFSPAFQELDRALAEAGRTGGAMENALTGLGGALAQTSRSAAEAGRATRGFADQAGASLESFLALRTELETQAAVMNEELALAQGERRLTIDEGFQQRMTQVTEDGLLQREQLERAYRELRESSAESERQAELQRELAQFEARLALARTFHEKLAALAQSKGRELALLGKGLAISSALFDAYRAANAALASVPFPFNFAAAALVLAEGLQNVQRIRQVNVAHGGLEDVPADSTFLLQRGERVLAPRQNDDLTEFLRGQRGGGRAEVVIQQLDIHVLENATAGQVLLGMGAAEWRQLVAERVIPALNELSHLGIEPAFSSRAS